MIAVRGYANRRVGVLGLGRSGLAAARALAAGEATPICWDDGEAAREKAAAEGFVIEDLTRPRNAEGLALLVVSPGIPHLFPAPHPAITAAQDAGALIDNDVGLFFRALAMTGSEARVVCVTGSNGKSTTSALIAHILAEAGRPVQLGGNIGRGVLDLNPPADGETIVLELSSYQTELARALAPDVAVFLNLSPDHLDRHGGLGGYFAAKRRLFELGAPERVIIGVDDDHGRFLAAACRDADEEGAQLVEIAAGRRLKGEAATVFLNKNHLTDWAKGKQRAALDLRACPALPGAHNGQNACAVYAACRALGLGPKAIEKGLQSFPGLPHRAQLVAKARGVRFVNDSKATNADAAEKALLAFENIRWIAGGIPKEGGIAALRPHFDRIVKTYLIGEAAEEFARTLADHPHEISRDLDAAARRAFAEAQPGEVILLSPACASFDQFTDYEARGNAFAALARQLAEEAA